MNATIKKQYLNEWIDNLPADQFECFYNFVNSIMDMNTKAMADSLKIDTTNMDFAKPQEWSDRLRSEGINPAGFIWSYKNQKSFGEPFALHTEMINQLFKLFA